MTAIELDFGPGLAPAGGSRHLASENEFELLTEYFSTAVRFAVGGAVVFAAELPLLNFVEMVALSAWAVAGGDAVQVSPEFGGAGSWSVEPEGDRVRLVYRCYVPAEKRHVTGSVSAGRVELVSALGAFTLRALGTAERVDAAVAQNPWTRRIRERTRAVLAELMDRSIVTVDMVSKAEADEVADLLAYRLWSYGGLPDEVPAPVRVEVLADAGTRHPQLLGMEMAGTPVVEALVPPDLTGKTDALAEAVWPAFADLLEVFGATSHPLYRAARA